MSLQRLIEMYSIYHPIVTVILILINVLIFLMETVAGSFYSLGSAAEFL